MLVRCGPLPLGHEDAVPEAGLVHLLRLGGQLLPPKSRRKESVVLGGVFRLRPLAQEILVAGPELGFQEEFYEPNLCVNHMPRPSRP